MVGGYIVICLITLVVSMTCSLVPNNEVEDVRRKQSLLQTFHCIKPLQKYKIVNFDSGTYMRGDCYYFCRFNTTDNYEVIVNAWDNFLSSSGWKIKTHNNRYTVFVNKNLTLKLLNRETTLNTYNVYLFDIRSPLTTRFYKKSPFLQGVLN